ncbi:NUDIX hydrolase [Macrococcus epidermidis]|uniref:NUDIX hydrolase n=2 Tax=Macrococcus epidermidis TaxID=1902580 RepID=A0A327ZYF1_9STAP|nr:NUDIX hydrolase [Macrococcus epidermidis]RAK47106.1 NUDIX hydrolase [Macrococcus epidermidis]
MMARDKVWLGVNAIVINDAGEWLLLKKQYSGMRGMWSTPAGFIDNGETADQAVIRELYEETGIKGEVQGVIGLRSGVINNEISDNMILFLVKPLTTDITIQFPNDEIEVVAWRTPEAILQDKTVSPMIHHLLQEKSEAITLTSTESPGAHFNYTHYHLFT